MDEIFEKLQSVVDRYDEISEMLSDPDIISDTNRFMALSKEEGQLRETVEVFKHYQAVIAEIESDKELLAEKLDADMEELTKEELKELESEKAELEERLKILLLPKDPNDDKNIIMEIHGAAGGDEGALFAADLYDMYGRYAERQGWNVEIIDENKTEIGGYKEIVLMITGNSVYSKLKYENGAHRVQRVPETESAGRVHTSTATVGVMPEYEDVDIDIEEKDLRVDVYRASGAGGQHINKTSSAVRLTHIPTGIVVASQQQRSQFQNKDTAYAMLRAKLYQLEMDKKEKERASIAGEQLENGWGSQIRSYVFQPYRMVKDHRTNYESGNPQGVMDGDLDPFINAYLRWKLAEQNPD